MLVKTLFLIAVPYLIVVGSVFLALSCKRHPITSAPIIPDETATRDTTEEQLDSDVNSSRKLITTVMIGLAIVLALSLLLTLIVNAESLAAVLAPIVDLLMRLDGNVVYASYIGITGLIMLVSIMMVQTWRTPLRFLIASLIWALVFMSWLLFDNWITFNLLTAVSTASVIVLFQQRMSFLKLSIILLIGAVLYDAVQVFGTGNMQTSVLGMLPTFGSPDRVLATPSLVVVPSDWSLQAQVAGLLGGGDVIVFGIMAVSAARFARLAGSSRPLHYCFAGFAVAMIMSSLIGWYFRAGQPATIYIVPLCALPVILYAWRHDSFRLLTVPFYDAPKKEAATTT